VQTASILYQKSQKSINNSVFAKPDTTKPWRSGVILSEVESPALHRRAAAWIQVWQIKIKKARRNAGTQIDLDPHTSSNNNRHRLFIDLTCSG